MLRDLLKEGGLYSLANLLTKGVSLLLIPFYTAYFSPADYGIIDILNLFNLFVTAIFTLQINQGLARYVAEPSLDKKSRVKFASSGIWFFIFFLAIVVSLLIIYPSWVINLLSEEVEIETTTFRYAVIALYLNAVFYLLGVHQRFLRKTKQFTLLSFIHSIGWILLILYFVLVQKLGIESIYLSVLFICPPLILIQFYLLRKHIKIIIDTSALKKILSFSIPLIPAAVAIILMNFTDRIYIKEYLNFNELGIYAIAGKFASVFTLVVAGITMAMSPILYEKHQEESTKKELGEIFRLYLAIGTITVFLISLFSSEIVQLVTAEAYHDSGKLIPIMIAAAFSTGFTMFSQGLNIAKKTAVISIVVICFAGLNALLNHFLIPDYALIGAAIATLTATVLYQFSYFFISQKHYEFSYKIKDMLVCSLLIVSLLFFIYLFEFDIYIISLFIKIGVFGLAILLIHFTGVFRFKEYNIYFKKLFGK